MVVTVRVTITPHRRKTMSAEPKQVVVTELDTTTRKIFYMDPFNVSIIGGKGPKDFGDETHPMYDKRILLPLDEQMLASIKADGIIVPIKAFSDGDKTVVSAGRRRVLHARAINLELQAANPGIKAEDMIRVPVVIETSSEERNSVNKFTENSHRLGVDPYERAKEMQKMLNKGVDEKRIRTIFGISVQQFAQDMKLLNLTGPALEAYQNKELSANAAAAVGSLQATEQLEALRKARDEAIAKGRKEGKLTMADVEGAVADSKARGGADHKTRKTPKQVVQAVRNLITELMVNVVKSDKPFAADGRTPAQPDPAAMFQALRKIAVLVDDSDPPHTWEKQFKTMHKQLVDEQAADEEQATGKPAKGATSEKTTTGKGK